MRLPLSAPNFRAELARHKISREAVCDLIGMHPNQLSNFVGGYRTIPFWAAHNIGYGINRTTGVMIFDVDMSQGVLPSEREAKIYVRDPKTSIRQAARGVVTMRPKASA